METDQGRHTYRLQSQAKQILLHSMAKLLLASLCFSPNVQCPRSRGMCSVSSGLLVGRGAELGMWLLLL